jgi:1,4-dihydroxy-2-naphthoate octaprenyltransferase
VAEGRPYLFYYKILGFLRSRLLGAVLMPALIGAAFALRQGAFNWLRFVLILVGLAAAEMLNLLGSDYQLQRNPDRKESRLPGNPVISTDRLPPSRIPVVIAPIALIGLAALVYFTITVGIGVLVFLLAAGIIGALYVFSPFRYAFLYTSLIPPLISGGVYLAMSGQIVGQAFAVGLPVTLISLAVILGYRVMYGREGHERRRARAVVLAIYCLAGIIVILYVAVGIYPWAGLTVLVPVVAFLCLVGTTTVRERKDPVPATALGVMMHTSTCLAIAVVLWLG